MDEIEAMLTPKRPYASELRAELRDYCTTYGATLQNDPTLRNFVALVRLVSDWERIDRIGAAKLRYLRQQRQREVKRERAVCGAKTRAGGTCQARVVDGMVRCRMHGGLSTGPKTAAGRAAIAESNRRRAACLQ